MSEQYRPVVERTPEHQTPVFLEKFRENPIGTPETWGAVPLLTSCEVQEQQNRIHADLSELFLPKNVPNYVSSNLASYIENTHLSRVQHRESKNRDSYTLRGNYDFEAPDFDTFDVFLRGQNGQASPAELLYLQQYWQMPSIELASLTHPYGERLYPNITEMRDASRDSIKMHQGIVFDEASIQKDYTDYEVKGADRIDDMTRAEGLHMTRKRALGVLPDNSYVIERSSFIIRLDGLPEKYSSAIRAIPFKNNKNWARQVLIRAEKFYELVPDLLGNDSFEVAIPLSTTIVSIHDERSDELTSRDAIDRRNNMIRNRADAKKSSLL